MTLACQPWCSPADLPGEGTDEQKTLACQTATDVLYVASGRRWPGECSTTIRPCLGGCSCWQVLEGSGHLVGPAEYSWPGAGPWLWEGREWRSPYGSCGCSPVAVVQLAGSGPWSVDEVRVGADVVPATAYRVDQDLVIRTDGKLWPSCQDLTADPGEPGAFTVSYTHGSLPPAGGVEGAIQLASELVKSITGDPTCALPRGVTRLVRQGVTIDKATTSLFAKGGRTGLVLVDLFLDTVNPNRMQAPSQVWSPDLPQPARKV